MYAIDQRRNTASSAPLAYPRRHCLSCVYAGPRFLGSWWSRLLFVAPPSDKHNLRTVRHRLSAPCQISFLLAVVFLCIKLPISSRPDIYRRARGGKVMAFGVCTVRWAPDWKMVLLSPPLSADTARWNRPRRGSRSRHPSCRWWN